MDDLKQPGRIGNWLEERIRFGPLIDFLRKKQVPRHRHSFWYVFGGLAFFFFCMQLLTGVLLLLYYSPTPASAYESVQFISTQVPFGWLIRSIHSWSANLLIGVVFVHFFSVFFLKAYRKPREMMWFSGVMLLFLTLGFGFTGYLLPWDTKAYFATKIGTEIPRTIPLVGEFVVSILRGGEYIAEESLKRLFALHVVILPFMTAALILFHLILNQVHGSSVPIASSTKEPAIPFFPNYLYRDIISWLVGLILLIALALLLPIELGIKADPLASAPLGIKPEWYFLTLFETLRLVPPEIFGVTSEVWVNLGVMIVTGGIFLVPILDRKASSPDFTVIGAAGLIYMIIAIALAYLTT